MKITRRNRVSLGTMRTVDVPVGTVFAGTVGGHVGVFLRTHNQVVFLDNPEHTWTGGASERGTPIIDYRPLDVELVVHGPAEEAGDDIRDACDQRCESCSYYFETPGKYANKCVWDLMENAEDIYGGEVACERYSVRPGWAEANVDINRLIERQVKRDDRHWR